MSTTNSLVGLLAIVLIYHVIVVQRILRRLTAIRESTLDRLRQSQENTARRWEESRKTLARQFDEMDAQKDRREWTTQMAEKQAARMEQLLNVEQEQLAALNEILKRLNRERADHSL